ncbi:MAG TPA: flagellin FliC, partial [Chromatiales bacterium]|nr:flagellin FliC [Chromatiales bacterium]
KTQADLSQALQRLSSGLRVNSAKDDAAGYYISQTMTADINGMNQAVRNANDGISFAQTADGGLQQISADLQRINQLAVESANGTVSSGGRTGIQAEVDQLTQDISQIVQTSKFAGVALLSAGGSTTFQVGAVSNVNDQISVTGLNLTTLKAYATSLTATGTVVVSSQSAASAAIGTTATDISTVAGDSATMGAVQNRFSAVIANLQNSVVNLSAARSRIVDVDFASETAKLSRAQILQQAGVAMLRQANTDPQVALTLLR